MTPAEKEETLVFSNSESKTVKHLNETEPPHKLLIVDDEEEVHTMTRMVLADYVYNGRNIDFLSAYTVPDAKRLIHKNPDAACILLDVVMDTDNAGLELVQFIREQEKNEMLRIILRTGQPGKAPEKTIILNYDINDYKEKTELTDQKLFTSITSALRSHAHLIELEKQRREISTKNTRLNEEIARRIVAEHNLTKYNRSLEKMLDSKSLELTHSLSQLEIKGKELQRANALAAIGNVSKATLSQFEMPGKNLEANLEKMDLFRSQITTLLEKYEVLRGMVSSQILLPDTVLSDTRDSLEDLETYKQNINLEKILTKYPEIIQESAERIKQISSAIKDIHQFIQIGEESFQKTDLNLLIQSAVKKIQTKRKTNIDLQIQLGEIPRANGPARGLETAFYEILKNAFDAVGKKGIVSVSSEYEDGKIQVHISDIGNGIEKQYLNKIFTPYFSTKGARGLGLTLARSVIKSSEADIFIKSQPSEGTHVILVFPVA